MAFLSFKWFTPFLFTLLHPFYVSVTELNHNAKDQSLEISCKLFAEDIESALKTQYKTSVDLSSQKMQPLNDKLLASYVSERLLLKADGKPVTLHYVGFEKQEEAIFCYFEVPKISSVKKIDIVNSLLQDFSDKQINIMHVTVGGQRKSRKLDYPAKDASFVF